MLSSWKKLSVEITLEPYFCLLLFIKDYVDAKILNASMFFPVIGNSIKYLVPLNPEFILGLLMLGFLI
jgi:hypothetical protein